VAADQKAGEVKHCSIIFLYKKTRKYILCWLFVVTSCEICLYVCPSKTRRKVSNDCYVNETISCRIIRV
jgi:hypothetical protein